ncbi:MAG: class I SAM-dependent methyltransferase [Gemmataceae bacterium]|nr:class I SAM-dependent methyltransferase [Gemmataceae bacterium]
MELKETYENRRIHAGWENVYRSNPLQDRFNAQMLERFLRILQVPPDSYVLDAGCGIGYHTLSLARHGYRCLGVDISEAVLEKARANAAKIGLAERVQFQCEKLEAIQMADATFDFVHCRGVLMHIPRWDKALAELCRVLKPGGKLLLLESNSAAVETLLVRGIRKIKKTVSRVEYTPGGIEFWTELDGQPFLVRIAHIPYLKEELSSCGVRTTHRLASEFWDIFRFPAGIVRNAAIRFNQLWFRLGLPAGPSVGNCVLGEKQRTRSIP